MTQNFVLLLLNTSALGEAAPNQWPIGIVLNNGRGNMKTNEQGQKFSPERGRRLLSTLPELTKDRYPVKRGPYGEVTQQHIKQFQSILNKERVLTDPDDVAPYNVDWIKIVRGCSKVVLRPRTTMEISEILKLCHAERLAVCPQGGNTGLVGGSVPVFDEVVLSTSLMNEIEKIDELSGVLVCQSGCVLEKLDSALRSRGLMMPLDLGAKGSCQIGGNVSTNAGGLRLLRYGSLQGSILGLEAVLASGEVLDVLNALKKDNTGFHLKHLFIGSEGTLGVVTKVAIHCPPAPKSLNCTFLGVEKFEDVLAVFQAARTNLGEVLSSCELIDSETLEICLRATKLHRPLATRHQFYMLIETSGSNDEHDQEKMHNFLEKMMENGVVKDGITTDEPSKMNHLWQVRERSTESLLSEGYVFKYDISLPLPHFYDIVYAIREQLKGTSAKTVCGYGHIGDGNIHLNITAPEFTSELLSKIEPFVFQWAQKYRGSVSAEHGIGFKKTQFLHFSKSMEAIKMMRDIKNLFDPKGILNPYKVLPQI